MKLIGYLFWGLVTVVVIIGTLFLEFLVFLYGFGRELKRWVKKKILKIESKIT